MVNTSAKQNVKYCLMETKYPMCLYYLDLLQYESFRKEVVNSQCCKFIDDQMILHWQHYTRKRMKLMETGVSQQGTHTPNSQTSSVIALPQPSATPSPATNMINGFNQGQKV
ncbi:Mediator of RNA polymerase II transcription subunit 31 [Armadillidium vulgare]|nr:Mediator of RNA polymerase II transcription subunit 31 [Armadillidium vulgare]